MKIWQLIASVALIGSFATTASAVTPILPPGSFIAYTDIDVRRGAVQNRTLNIGRTFTVTGTGINVSALGIFDFQSNGLVSGHTVSLFSTGVLSQSLLASVSVADGIVAPLVQGFRFTNLPSALYLAAGEYSLIGYGLNSADGDPYGDLGGLPAAGSNVIDGGFDPFQFTTAGSPAYPTGGDTRNHSSVSFIYNVATVPEPDTWGLMICGFFMVGGALRLTQHRTRVSFAEA